MVDVPAPQLRPEGVLVRNRASLISKGTESAMLDLARKSLLSKARDRPDLVRKTVDKAVRDGVKQTLETVRDQLELPSPLGYSSAGSILEVGETTTGLSQDDLVACGGAGYANHAEVVYVPRTLVVPLPLDGDGAALVTFEQAAFATVGSVALHGVRLSDARLGDVVVVVGLGLIGLLALQMARAAGCVVVGLDPNEARRDLASRVGADGVAGSAKELEQVVSDLSTGRGADACLIAAATNSNEPLEVAATVARDRGRLVAIGATRMDVPRREFYEKELSLVVSRSYGPGRYDAQFEDKGIDYPYGFVRWTEQRNMSAVLQMIATRKLDVDALTTHSFETERAPDAYRALEEADDAIGIVLRYQPAPAGASSDRVERHPRPGRPQRRQERTSTGGRVTSLRVGVIGTGDFARRTLLPLLASSPSAELVSVSSIRGMNAAAVAEKFEFRRSASGPGEVLEADDIDLVFVVTRHDSHAELACAALANGKHVFVEKPLALDADQLGQVARALEDSSCVLHVGFNRRFAAHTQELIDFFQGRREPLAIDYRVNAGRIPIDHWVHDPAIGGGRLVGEGCHFIDWMSHVADAPATSIFCRNLPEPGRYGPDDNLFATVSLADGSIGTLTYLANSDRSLPKETISVSSQGTTAVIDDFRRVRFLGQGRGIGLSNRLRGRQDKGHAAQLTAFLEACRHPGASPFDTGTYLNVTAATFAGLRSLRSGEPQAVVQP